MSIYSWFTHQKTVILHSYVSLPEEYQQNPSTRQLVQYKNKSMWFEHFYTNPFKMNIIIAALENIYIYMYTYIFIHTYTCSVWSGQRYRAAGEILLWIKDIYIYKHVGWRHLISSHLYSWKLSNMRCLFGRVIHRMINFYEVPYIIIDPKKLLIPL